MSKYMKRFDKREYYLYGKCHGGSPSSVKAAIRRLRKAGNLVRLVKYKKDKGKTVFIFIRKKEKNKKKNHKKWIGGKNHGKRQSL